MKRFTESVRSSISHKDWYVALATALTLPDVCGRLINPTLSSSARYTNWFDTWVAHDYKRKLRGVEHVFLTASDCYALRCSYLHEGGGDISQQRARKVLNDFQFTFPPGDGTTIHCNYNDNNGFHTLQLQVDEFCLGIAGAVDKWAESVLGDVDIQGRMTGLLTIHASASFIKVI